MEIVTFRSNHVTITSQEQPPHRRSLRLLQQSQQNLSTHTTHSTPRILSLFLDHLVIYPDETYQRLNKSTPAQLVINKSTFNIISL